MNHMENFESKAKAGIKKGLSNTDRLTKTRYRMEQRK